MNPWLAALLGAWVGAFAGFMLAAILGARHVDRSPDLSRPPDAAPIVSWPDKEDQP